MDSDRLRQFVLQPAESAKLDFKIELYKINEPKPTVQADIQRWTDAREQQWAELTKDIIALANGNIGTATQIGYLIIGADDKLKPDGTPNLRDVDNKVPTRKEILDKVNSYCQIPLPDIQCEKILLDGINLFVISIPPSPYLHRLSKQLKTPKKEYSPHTVLVRRGDGERTYEASSDEQKAIEQEKQTTLLKYSPGETAKHFEQELDSIDTQAGKKVVAHDRESVQGATPMLTTPRAKREASQEKLLQAVATEVQERLAQSLHNAVWLTLGMERQDYRVQRPWSAMVAQQSQSAVPLDAGTRIVEVFDRPELARQLLILGEPGAGKTTMMLELAEDLLKRATADKAEPIPVLLSLSSWKNPEQSFFEWLVSELKRKYGRLFQAQQWLEKNQLLPLLDGLDEVAPQHQQACAVALNAWLTGELVQRPCGVVICCRREEFEQVVRQPLSVHGAIYLQSLTVEQIEDYFAQFELQDVWQTVQQDEALQKLLTTPLFLSMFGWVQKQGKFSLSDWRSHTTSNRQVEYLLDTYWEAAITRELIIDPNDKQRGILSKTYGTKPLPTRKAVQRALVFVAKVLEQELQTDFLIEALQPCHLFSKELKETYCIRVKWGIDLILGLLFGIFIGFTEKSPSGLIAVIIFVLTSGKKPEFFQKIQPVESLGWSWFRARSALKIALFALLIVVPALLFVFLFLSPKINLFLGMIATIFIVIPLGLTAGVFGVDIESKRIPNQGILKSAASFLMVSLMGGILLGVIVGLSIKLTGQSTNWFVTGIGALLFLGLILGLNFGGYACIQHLALRLILYRNGSISWDYARFLNYATERLLLQRIGGRYRFMHKLLQDHFAKMDLE